MFNPYHRVFTALFILLPVLPACSLLGMPENPAVFEQLTVSAYETHVVCKGDALADLDQDLLVNYDTIILGAQNFPHLEERLRSAAVLYFNPWGKSRYSDDLEWIRWQVFQPAPAELGEPDVVLNYGVHCYRFDNAHVERFLGWIEHFLATHGHEVRGVFLDDFGYDRSHWAGADSLKDAVWGPADGYPGWREDPEGWNVERILAIEEGAKALVETYCNANGVTIINGSARSLPGVRRFAEDVGVHGWNRWYLLENEVDDPLYALPGDYLQINGMGASGQWGDWTENDRGNGYENLQHAARLARERGLSVGLAYGETPVQGGTIYQLYLDPADFEHPWPLYFDLPSD